VSTTAAHYTAKREGVLTGLGSVLAESPKVVPMIRREIVSDKTNATA
jgi:hypothetical protein